MASLAYVCFLSVLCTVNSNSLNNLLFNGDYEFIELTHPFDNFTVNWPGTQKFQFTRKKEEYVGPNNSWYASYEYASGEHVGTHIDAPFHFNSEGKRVGDIPIEKLIVPLIVVDVSSIANNRADFVLHKHNLDYILNDNMGKPCLVVFKFGWSKYFYTPMYLGHDKRTDSLHFPGLSAEVAEWIATSYKNVVGVGVDVASVDPGSSTDYLVHKTFAKAGLYHVENVNLHRDIPEHGCTALVMPMKISEGTGAPTRLVAICPKGKPTSFNN